MATYGAHKEMRCLICKKDLGRHSSNCVVFSSSGTYGSVVFDHTGKSLEVWICDVCMVANLDDMLGRIERTEKTVEYMDPKEAIEEDTFEFTETKEEG